MKLTTLALGLILATSAMADSASVTKEGSVAELSGSLNGVNSEIFKVVAVAFEKGFKNAQGADFFDHLSSPNRVGGMTKYVNKNLTVKVQSGITLSYSADLKGKKGDFKLAGKVLTITGEAAKLLKGAMSYSATDDGPRPVGSSRESTKSGKVVCSRVVYPNAPTVCVIKL